MDYVLGPTFRCHNVWSWYVSLPAWSDCVIFPVLLTNSTTHISAGPLLSASTLIVQEEFNLTLAEAGQATAGYQILGVAVSEILPMYHRFSLANRHCLLWSAGVSTVLGSFCD